MAGRCNWKAKIRGSKGNWFACLNLGGVCHALIFPTAKEADFFPSVFNLLDLAISVGERDGRLYPAGVVSVRVQNS